MTNENDNGRESPFPSQAEMDLDLWHASPTVHPLKFGRDIEGVAGATICTVYGTDRRDADRDSTARRIEQMGDVYEELRKLVDRAKAAGLDVSQAEITLNDFIAPKPFPESV